MNSEPQISLEGQRRSRFMAVLEDRLQDRGETLYYFLTQCQKARAAQLELTPEQELFTKFRTEEWALVEELNALPTEEIGPCPGCGGPGDDIDFDRSICSCGDMHYYCANCGRLADECPDL